MGLRENITNISGGGNGFITIVHGQFTQRVEEGTKGAISRELTKGKNEGTTVWELHFPALSGMLMGVDISESKFGGQDGTITLKDFKTGETFSIQTGADNGKFTDFLKCLPNIDTNKEVVLEMRPKKGGKVDTNGNPITDMKVVQDGRIVPNYYQEWDNTDRQYVCINGMPDWEKTPKGWNHDDQDFFLWDRCAEWQETFIPPISDPDFRREESPAEEMERVVPEDDGSDSIPF